MEFDFPPVPNWINWLLALFTTLGAPVVVRLAWKWCVENLAKLNKVVARRRARRKAKGLIFIEYLLKNPSIMSAWAVSHVIWFCSYALVVTIMYIVAVAIIIAGYNKGGDVSVEHSIYSSIRSIVVGGVISVPIYFIQNVHIRMRNIIHARQHRRAELDAIRILLIRSGESSAATDQMLANLIENMRRAFPHPSPFDAAWPAFGPDPLGGFSRPSSEPETLDLPPEDL